MFTGSEQIGEEAVVNVAATTSPVHVCVVPADPIVQHLTGAEVSLRADGTVKNAVSDFALYEKEVEASLAMRRRLAPSSRRSVRRRALLDSAAAEAVYVQEVAAQMIA